MLNDVKKVEKPIPESSVSSSSCKDPAFIEDRRIPQEDQETTSQAKVSSTYSLNSKNPEHVLVDAIEDAFKAVRPSTRPTSTTTTTPIPSNVDVQAAKKKPRIRPRHILRQLEEDAKKVALGLLGKLVSELAE